MRGGRPQTSTTVARSAEMEKVMQGAGLGPVAKETGQRAAPVKLMQLVVLES